MHKIELLFFPDCPNVERARGQIRRALDELGLPQSWTEIDVTSSRVPERLRGFGSPTVLVDGRDVSGGGENDGATCRVYAASDVAGAPSVASIVAALDSSVVRPPRQLWVRFGSLPGILLSALPVVACPSCWPGYAALVGSLGVPFLLDSKWMVSLTASALAIAVGALAYVARQRGTAGPLMLGVLASAAILSAKLDVVPIAIGHIGTVALVASTIWSAKSPRPAACATCACESQGTPG